MNTTIIYTGLKPPKKELKLPEHITLYHLPTIEISYEHPVHFGNVSKFLNKHPIVIFLSKNGVIGLNRWLRQEDIDLSLHKSGIWAIGAATAKKVRDVFGIAVNQLGIQNSKGLIDVLQTSKKQPILLFCAREVRPELPEWLEENQWEFLKVPVYCTNIIDNRELETHFQNSAREYVFFTSPSTVRGFLRSLRRPNFLEILANLVSIGPTTTAEIQTYGGQVFREAEEPAINKMLEKLILGLEHSDRKQSTEKLKV